MHGLLHAIKWQKEVCSNYLKFTTTASANGGYTFCYQGGALPMVSALQRHERRGEQELRTGPPLQSGDYRRKFDVIPDYDPESDYEYSFGIINGTAEKPETIELSFTPCEGRYVKSCHCTTRRSRSRKMKKRPSSAMNLAPPMILKWKSFPMAIR